MTAAPLHLRLWLLFCSDLAIRSGTAAKLTPRNYDPFRRELNFTTKNNAPMCVPVTERIAALLDAVGRDQLDVPFTSQLHPRGAVGAWSLRFNFKRLLAQVGVSTQIRPHDFRRTTAERIYDVTHDLRKAQAVLGHSQLSTTLWYLQRKLRPIDLALLEDAAINRTETSK